MIYLVRHGQTDWNLEKRMQGQTDISLNETGRMQAKNVSEEISKLKISKVICSDLARAKETAEIINEKIGCSIITDKRIREFNYGDLEGISREEITQEMWETVNKYPEKLNCESMADIFKRIKSFCEELKDESENILIVTHGGALRMIMYYAENKDEFDAKKYEKYKLFKIQNGDIFEWDGKSILHKRD